MPLWEPEAPEQNPDIFELLGLCTKPNMLSTIVSFACEEHKFYKDWCMKVSQEIILFATR